MRAMREREGEKDEIRQSLWINCITVSATASVNLLESLNQWGVFEKIQYVSIWDYFVRVSVCMTSRVVFFKYVSSPHVPQ